MRQERLPVRGEEVELVAETSGFGGRAIARRDNLVYFLRGAVPGDVVRAVVTKRKRNFVEALVQEVLQPSPHRISPICRHFESCGGCHWQDLDYDSQLQEKQRHVEDLMERMGGLTTPISPIRPAPRPYFYRNKMEFSFGTSRWLSREEIDSDRPLKKDFALGLHVPARFDKIVDVEECFLQSDLSTRILKKVREIALEEGWSAYDSRSHRGFLRNLVIRDSEATGEILVALVTTRSEEERLEQITQKLIGAIDNVTTFLQIVNSSRSPVASGEERIWHGKGYITERIGQLSFRISPSTFFQPNTLQAEALYGLIRQLAQPDGTETLYDLYCGVGCIGLFLSSSVAQVAGFETHPQAVEKARENASLNGVGNISFRVGRSVDALEADIVEELGRPDIVILDPPRPGLEKGMVERLSAVRPRRIIYVSCNPATQARDLAQLNASYQVTAVHPVDMFPQTPHIECVARLDRIDDAVAGP